MSFCSRCDRPYGDGSGDGECDLAAIEDELEAVGYDPAHSPPIPFGAETTVFFAGWGSALATVPDRPTCPDCGVRRGCYHHAGCSVEQCGECRQQAIDCDCLAIDDEDDEDDGDDAPESAAIDMKAIWPPSSVARDAEPNGVIQNDTEFQRITPKS